MDTKPVNHQAGARLRRPGLWGRAAVMVLVAGGIIAGTWQRNDQGWPFAPMSQFAFAVSPTDGEIHSRYLEATTVEGQRVTVDLTRGALGLGRAEIEGQLWSFRQQPDLLQAIAVLHARRMPDAPRFAIVELMDDVRVVSGGVPGPVRTDVVVSWNVVDPADPQELR